MSKPIISVESLGKRYQVGRRSVRSVDENFREALSNQAKLILKATRRALRRQSRSHHSDAPEFWALRDVTFEIAPGQVVGIIGRNGAGKSTLLKILSRITEPSEGRACLRGRVASLLEVGTGFHPELTGRENIYLNGSILGMSRAEVRRKFDEIVAFSEVERFLDTPVKRYSSGMYVRLAFAVAAHLEPEILIVDEVLAVGDAKFQEKCLGKMHTVSQGGRTVLFVSHNLAAVRRLCGRAILISDGRVREDGKIESVVSAYMNDIRARGSSTQESIAEKIASFVPDRDCQLLNVTFQQEGTFPAHVESDKPLTVACEYEVHHETYGLHSYFRLFDDEGGMLFESIDSAESSEVPTYGVGHFRSTATIPANLLAPRRYELHIGLAIAQRRYCTPEPIVIPFDVYLTGKINQSFQDYESPGKLLPSIPWDIERI